MATTLSDFFEYHKANSLPFAFYKLPGQKTIHIVAQKSPHLKSSNEDLTAEKGFLFAPFAEAKKNPGLFVAADILSTENNLPVLNYAGTAKKQKLIKTTVTKTSEARKEEFKTYVKKIKAKIAKGDFKKIVAARISLKKRPKEFSPVFYFKELADKYPNAFVSLVYTAKSGLWIGASPEILVEVTPTGFKTYSLAGTKFRTQGTSVVWGTKERHEQKVVSDYMLQTFKKISKEKPRITGPETISAGNLQHLRTTFLYRSIPYSHWQHIAEALHPTPAIAGLPKQKAIDFIIKNEAGARAYYAGYLGPVNINHEIHLFVNLRCMQVLKNKLAVHVGCGITADSNPEAEWQESKAKTKTLGDLLK